MTCGVICIGPDMTIAEAARVMRDNNIGCLPVLEDGKLIGIVTQQDMATRATADGADPSITLGRCIMTVNVVCCGETDKPEHALQIMQKQKIRHLPVCDGSGELTGMLTLSDLALNGPQELAVGIAAIAFARSWNMQMGMAGG